MSGFGSGFTFFRKREDQLRNEVERLRGLLETQAEVHTHQCRKCLVCYTPAELSHEDCPHCGHDGTDVPKGCRHEWSQTDGEADESDGRIFCMLCGEDGDG